VLRAGAAFPPQLAAAVETWRRPLASVKRLVAPAPPAAAAAGGGGGGGGGGDPPAAAGAPEVKAVGFSAAKGSGFMSRAPDHW
jgi:hypothetical protein